MRCHLDVACQVLASKAKWLPNSGRSRSRLTSSELILPRRQAADTTVSNQRYFVDKPAFEMLTHGTLDPILRVHGSFPALHGLIQECEQLNNIVLEFTSAK
jgi:hypothetical protein